MWLFDLFKRKKIKKHRYKIAYSKKSGHATATFERHKNRTKGITITHQGDGPKRIPLNDNPDPDDKRPAYISTKIDIGKRSSFVFNSIKYKKYKLSKENKRIMDKMIADKEIQKKRISDGKKRKNTKYSKTKHPFKEFLKKILKRK